MRFNNRVETVLFLCISFKATFCAIQPNILFILADDYGWNDVGFHGSEIKTPAIDQLAAEGVKLNNYYVQPICTPTRSQLMSGRYQIHTGLQHGIIWASQPNGLPLEIPTMADSLRKSGYSTHMVGKWHLGFYRKEYMPTYRGFDSYYGYLTGSEDYYTHHRCDGDHTDERRLNKNVCGYDLRDNERPVNASEYSAYMYAKRAEMIVQKHDKNKPLFMYVALQSVHAPLQVPATYEQRYQHIQNKARRTYAGMVSCLDDVVANITSAFKKAGLWNNTVLVFSTDNGGQVLAGGNNWPLRGWKGSLWEGGMRGVGFVDSALLNNRRSTYPGLLHVSDWYPTFVSSLARGSLAGLKLDGHDVWSAISHGTPSPRKELLHNIDPLTPPMGKPLHPDIFDNRIRAAIRVGDWKLITGSPGQGKWIPPPHVQSDSPSVDDNPAQNLWLFNIAKDPNEKDDLSEKHPEIVRQLLQRLAAYNATAVPVRYPASDPKCDPQLHGGFWGPWQS